MSDLLLPLAEALKREPAFVSLSGLFTHVPKETPYPYLTLEKTKSEEGFQGVRATVLVKVWSRYAGSAEVTRYEEALKNLLERPGWIPDMCLKIEEAKISVLTDGLTRVLQVTCHIWKWE